MGISVKQFVALQSIEDGAQFFVRKNLTFDMLVASVIRELYRVYGVHIEAQHLFETIKFADK